MKSELKCFKTKSQLNTKGDDNAGNERQKSCKL